MTPAQQRQAEKIAKAESEKGKKRKKNSALDESLRKRMKAQKPVSLAQRRQQEKNKQFLAVLKSESDEQLANQTAQAIKDGLSVEGQPSSYEIAVLQLEQHLKMLSGKSAEDKASMKYEFIKEYMGFLEDYRSSGQKYVNEVLSRIIVWMMDCEQFELALDWADFAIEQQQPSPKHFSRDFPTVVCESIHGWAKKQFEDTKKSDSAAPYFDQMIDRLTSGQWVVSEIIVESKIYKLAGNMAMENENYASAVEWYSRAVEANPTGHGCKTALAKATLLASNQQ